MIPVLDQLGRRQRCGVVAKPLEIIVVKLLCQAERQRIERLLILGAAGIEMLGLQLSRIQTKQREQPLQILVEVLLSTSEHQISQGIWKGIQPAAGRLKMGDARRHVRQMVTTG